MIFEQSGGLLHERALYFRLRGDFVTLPLLAPPGSPQQKARPSMNFTDGARPTADFGRFGRKNNIFYPLWRKSTLHFAPA